VSKAWRGGQEGGRLLGVGAAIAWRSPGGGGKRGHHGLCQQPDKQYNLGQQGRLTYPRRQRCAIGRPRRLGGVPGGSLGSAGMRP
jgi:hypothetical protein